MSPLQENSPEGHWAVSGQGIIPTSLLLGSKVWNPSRAPQEQDRIVPGKVSREKNPPLEAPNPSGEPWGQPLQQLQGHNGNVGIIPCMKLFPAVTKVRTQQFSFHSLPVTCSNFLTQSLALPLWSNHSGWQLEWSLSCTNSPQKKPHQCKGNRIKRNNLRACRAQ